MDRNGEPLAISTPVDSVWANPTELAPAVDNVPELARILELDSQLLIRRITRSMDKEFLYLKRHLSPDQAARVMALKLPGINVQREYRRYYPQIETAAQVIGFAGRDHTGLEGLEQGYERVMSGAAAERIVLRDANAGIVLSSESIERAASSPITIGILLGGFPDGAPGAHIGPAEGARHHGSLVGLLFKKGIPDSYKNTIMQAVSHFLLKFMVPLRITAVDMIGDAAFDAVDHLQIAVMGDIRRFR